MNPMNKILLSFFFLIFSSFSYAENIKFFIHTAGGEPHKYALALKPVAQKDGDNLIIEVTSGSEFSGVAKAFKNEKGPTIAIVSGTSLAKGIKNKKYKAEDYSFGKVLFFSDIGLVCKKPCQFKSFEDIIGNTRKTLKIAVSSAVSRNLFDEMRKSGVKSIAVPYGGWSEILPDLMSGTLDLASVILVDRKNDNIEYIVVPEKYGIQTKTWLVILYKNIPEEKFLKWYNDNSFVESMKIPKNVRETNYINLLNETVKNIQ
jgi:hypothetical protein